MEGRDFEVNKEEVLRYLGYGGQEIDCSLHSLIDSLRKEIKELSKIRFIYKEYNIKQSDGVIELENSSISLAGQSIAAHLQNSKTAIVMAVTLGNNVDLRIRYYEKIDMQKALILDACATTLIEEVCDVVERAIRDKVAVRGNLNYRYSPGYGDLTLDCQRDIVTSLETPKYLGLNLNSHNILIPRKSVTAILGWASDEKPVETKRGCEYCRLKDSCNFRKGGKGCGNK